MSTTPPAPERDPSAPEWQFRAEEARSWGAAGARVVARRTRRLAHRTLQNRGGVHRHGAADRPTGRSRHPETFWQRLGRLPLDAEGRARRPQEIVAAAWLGLASMVMLASQVVVGMHAHALWLRVTVWVLAGMLMACGVLWFVRTWWGRGHLRWFATPLVGALLLAYRLRAEAWMLGLAAFALAGALLASVLPRACAWFNRAPV